MSILTTGNKIEFYPDISKEEEQQGPYVSQVDEVIDETHIKILAPIQKGIIVSLRLHERYEFVFYTPKGVIGCNGEIINRNQKNGLHFMIVQLNPPFKKVQRRSFYRMECILSFQYLLENGEQIGTGVIKDISGGGIRFIGNKEVALGQRITCMIPMPTKELFTVKGQVLFKRRSSTDQYPYEHRVQFIDLDPKDQEMIIRYIFLEQRKRRSKERGLQ